MYSRLPLSDRRISTPPPGWKKAVPPAKPGNDPARFVGKLAVTKDGEAAGIKYFLDEDKIAEEARYDGLYAVCTDLLDDDAAPILKVSEADWCGPA